jgi:hypothetical protein
MKLHDFPESDWKVFRELREVALDRFCRRVVDEIEPLRLNAPRSHHERYLDLLRLLQERDQEIANAFDDPRRSQMIFQLAAMHACGLLEPEESRVSCLAPVPRSSHSPRKSTGNA